MSETNEAAPPTPTMADIAYGEHPRQRIDVYLPDGDGPFPLVMGIHGGGWVNGDKNTLVGPAWLGMLPDRGCAVATINYRFVADGTEAGIVPPVMAPLHDAKRALQFIRHHAAEWRIDPARVALIGGSAGACSSLWLAFHPEMADPDSDDPIARESTRVSLVATVGAQTSMDPVQMRQWVGPRLVYGGHAFGCADFDEFLARRDELIDQINEVSPAALLGPGDPPILMYYGEDLSEENREKGYFTHSPRFGLGLAELAEKHDVRCTVGWPGQGPWMSQQDLAAALADELLKL